MTAQAANRNNPLSDDVEFHDPAAADVHVFAGALVVLDTSGNARPGRTSTTDRAHGFAVSECDNSDGDAGDKMVKSRARVGLCFNSEGGDEIGPEDAGSACYVVDDQTVAKTSNGGTRIVAGYIVRMEGDMVAVRVGHYRGGDGDLVAANDLSDVNDVATARANLGANQMLISLGRVSTKASDAKVAYATAPVACTIVKFFSRLNDALATADAQFQLQSGADVAGLADVGSTTTGLITVTQAGSAAGDGDDATPLTTNLACAAGELIAAVVEGGSTATGTADLWVLVTY